MIELKSDYNSVQMEHNNTEVAWEREAPERKKKKTPTQAASPSTKRAPSSVLRRFGRMPNLSRHVVDRPFIDGRHGQEERDSSLQRINLSTYQPIKQPR